jgi:hypothetical protein
MDERKDSKTPNTSNLMLEARFANSKEIPESSSIKDSKEGFALTSSLALEFIVIVEFKALDNRAQIIHYCLTNEPSIKRKNPTRNSNCNLFVVTHDNSLRK